MPTLRATVTWTYEADESNYDTEARGNVQQMAAIDQENFTADPFLIAGELEQEEYEVTVEPVEERRDG